MIAVGHVRPLRVADRVSCEIELHGYSLSLDQSPDSADLAHQTAQRLEHFLVVGGAARNGHRRGRRDGCKRPPDGNAGCTSDELASRYTCALHNASVCVSRFSFNCWPGSRMARTAPPV